MTQDSINIIAVGLVSNPILVPYRPMDIVLYNQTTCKWEEINLNQTGTQPIWSSEEQTGVRIPDLEQRQGPWLYFKDNVPFVKGISHGGYICIVGLEDKLDQIQQAAAMSELKLYEATKPEYKLWISDNQDKTQKLCNALDEIFEKR